MFAFLKRDSSKRININELEDLIGSVELIDIREPYELKSGSVKTAKNIPMGNLLANPEKHMNKDKTYYIICQTGLRSARTVRALTKKGFKVIDVAGGITSYLRRQK